MAEFCRQCAADMFGTATDFADDFAGLTSPEAWAAGRAAVVLCEGCGPILVDPGGSCVSPDCLKRHGLPKGQTP